MKDPHFLKDYCQRKHCRKASYLLLGPIGLCWEHWEKACKDSAAKGGTASEAIFPFLLPDAADALIAYRKKLRKMEAHSN